MNDHLIPAPTYPEPQPLLPDLEPSNPYPLEALGDLLGGAAQAIIEIVQVPGAMAAQSVLAAAAMAVQPHGNINRSGQIIPLSLFCLTVAESGDRKSTADRLALQSHHKHQRELVEQYKADNRKYSSLRDAHQKARSNVLSNHIGNTEAVAADLDKLSEPEPPRLPFIFSEEPTLEGLQKSLLHGQPSQGLFSDEGGQFFGGYANKPENVLKSAAGLSKLWDGAPVNRTRAAKDEINIRYGCRLSVHLMVQPVVADIVLSDPLLRGQGFLARFLIAWPESLAGTRLYQDLDSNSDPRITRYWACMTRLLAMEPLVDELGDLAPPELRIEPAAKTAWIAAHDAIEVQIGPLGDLGDIKPMAAKAAEDLLRIAGVFAVVEGHQAIGVELIERATVLVHWYLAEALRLATPTKVDPELFRAQRLLEWLLEKDWREFHRDKLGKQGPLRNRAKQRDAALGLLVERGWLSSADGKNFRLNHGIRAESAESEEIQLSRELTCAEEVRRSAETQAQPEKSALLRTASALPDPCNSEPSALSALSASPNGFHLEPTVFSGLIDIDAACEPVPATRPGPPPRFKGEV